MSPQPISALKGCLRMLLIPQKQQARIQCDAGLLQGGYVPLSYSNH